MDEIKAVIREIPDFPKPGILFYDITTVLSDPDAFGKVIDEMAARHGDRDVQCVVGMESRGFIFGCPLAIRLGVPFVPVRKAGKLPAETVSAAYALEYGEAVIEIHKDAITPGQKVLVVDDLLATGGTAEATVGRRHRGLHVRHRAGLPRRPRQAAGRGGGLAAGVRLLSRGRREAGSPVTPPVRARAPSWRGAASGRSSGSPRCCPR